MATDPDVLPYELRIGVTGHRELADGDAIARAVERLLDYVVTTLDRTIDAPLTWTVVSPLAKGADRIVADAVLQRAGAHLQVITPLPLDDYRRDFRDPPDREAFDRLLTRASSIHELTGAAERDLAYFHAGERVADACEILICVWNGRPAAGVGGTADVVQYALQRERTVLWIHADDPTSPARLLVGVDVDENRSGELALRSVDLPTRAKELSRGYHEQASYAADTALTTAFCDENLEATTAPLRRSANTSGVPAVCIDAIVDALAAPYVRADQLAILYQRRYVRATNAILYLAASAVTVAVAQVLFFPARAWLILFEVAGMLAVFGVWWYSRREAWHEKWLHDRYLAEQLRAAMFLTLLGPGDTDPLREDPLPFYPGPHQWLEMTVGILVQRARIGLPSVALGSLKRFLIDAWLLDQERFHTRNSERKTLLAERRHRLGFMLFGVTLLMALLHVLGVGHTSSQETWRVAHLDLWITFFVLVLPVWAASIHAATSQLELDRIAARSKRMARMLDWHSHRAEQATSLPELRDVALDAARLMGNETREWWALLSFQDVKLHV